MGVLPCQPSSAFCAGLVFVNRSALRAALVVNRAALRAR
jgi:hypothetical protein